MIVESPTKAKTIGKYLGAGYDVKATVGHLRDLPTRELGVDVERDFEPKYVTIKGKTKTLAELKKAAKTASTIYLATDPDREGEAIAWHVADQLGSSAPTHRVLFHEITKDAIHEAMEHPGEIDDRKVNAQQARRILDRLVGYKASPILWRSIKTGLSAGRVQTVALRLIVEREREIRAFTPQEYWSIEALLRQGRPDLRGRARQGGRPQAAAPLGRGRAGRGGRGAAAAVRRHQGREAATAGRTRRAPFTTSTLQQEAAKKLGFSSRRTMRAAQDLYEGMDVGEDGPVGLITYMRTDSVRVSDAAIASVRDFIGVELRQAVPARTRRTPTARKKNARVQDAHEAVRPTDVRRRPEQVQALPRARPVPAVPAHLAALRRLADDAGGLRHDDRGLRPRASTSSGPPARCSSSTGTTCSIWKGARRRRGRRWTTSRRSRRSPQGDRVEVREITPSQHFTEPPPRFSEASLVKELERLGIGRPSTYSAIISTLSAREYVKVEQRRFFPTELGELVEKIMVGQVPRDLQRRVHLRAWRRSSTGSRTASSLWQGVLKDFYTPVQQGARGGGPERARGRRARAQARGPGQGALPQVRLGRSSSRPGASGRTWPASSTRTPATT